MPTSHAARGQHSLRRENIFALTLCCLVALLPLAFFVAFVQTLVFTLLSMIYISEVSHGPHEHTHGGEHSEFTGEAITTAHV